MATLFDFFLRRGEPQPPPPPGKKEEAVGERLSAEIDEAFAPLDISGEVAENVKKDLKDALTIRGKAPPGYEPEAVLFARINLVDAVTDPSKTAWKAISSVFENRSRPSITLAWSDSEGDVWETLFSDPRIGWMATDAYGNPVIPTSLRQAVLRWNDGARNYRLRLLRERGAIRENPGLSLMMAQQLNFYYTTLKVPAPTIAGTPLTSIINETRSKDLEISHLLALADQAEKGGRHGEAVGLWGEATKRQGGWAKSPQAQAYRPELFKEFERISRLGQRKDASYAAWVLGNSPEAQFWRYWHKRNLYFQTLNFLQTLRDDGIQGVAREYLWRKFIMRAFPKGTPLYLLYPPNAIRVAVGWSAKKLRLTAIVNKLTDAKALFARTWKRFIKDPLTKGVEWIRDKIVRKAVGWVAMKLGLTGLGAALGSVVPGAGTAIGAVLSAIGSFLVETAVNKMGGVWRVALFGVIGGLSLSLGILFAVAIMIMGVTVLIFNTNAVLPSAITAVPITVTKEACEPAPSCDEFDNPLQIEKDGLVHPIRWRITIKNTGEAGEQINWGDDYCQPGGDPSGFPIPIGPGGEITAFCNQNITANEDKVVTNTVRGTTTPATAPFSGTGAVIVGEPSTAYPIGWPLASGYITQGPNAPYSHTGDEAIDIDYSNAGNPVLATHSGVVVSHCYSVSGCTAGYGNYVRVRSSAGFETVFAHLDNVYVRTGDPVFFGQPVGTVGNTGNSDGFHLHYEFFGLEMAPPYIPQEVPPCVSRSVCDIHW